MTIAAHIAIVDDEADITALIGASLQALDQQTQANAALVEETAAAASSLHDQAIALSRRVARFKMPA